MPHDVVQVLLIEDNEEQTEFLRRLLATSELTTFVLHAARDLAQGLDRLPKW